MSDEKKGRAGRFYSLNEEKVDQTMKGFLRLVIDWWDKETVKAMIEEMEEP